MLALRCRTCAVAPTNSDLDDALPPVPPVHHRHPQRRSASVSTRSHAVPRRAAQQRSCLEQQGGTHGTCRKSTLAKIDAQGPDDESDVHTAVLDQLEQRRQSCPSFLRNLIASLRSSQQDDACPHADATGLTTQVRTQADSCASTSPSETRVTPARNAWRWRGCRSSSTTFTCSAHTSARPSILPSMPERHDDGADGNVHGRDTISAVLICPNCSLPSQ